MTLTATLIYISKDWSTTDPVVERMEDLRTEARGSRWISIHETTAHQSEAGETERRCAELTRVPVRRVGCFQNRRPLEVVARVNAGEADVSTSASPNERFGDWKRQER